MIVQVSTSASNAMRSRSTETSTEVMFWSFSWVCSLFKSLLYYCFWCPIIHTMSRNCCCNHVHFYSLVPRPPLFFVLQFAFSIIHVSGRARKMGRTWSHSSRVWCEVRWGWRKEEETNHKYVMHPRTREGYNNNMYSCQRQMLIIQCGTVWVLKSPKILPKRRWFPPLPTDLPG